MTRKRIATQYTFGIIMCVLIAILAAFEKGHVSKNRRSAPANKNSNILPYRTIDALDGSKDLFAYEFHKRTDDMANQTTCSAIIRSIEPAKDDYKTYCRSVISDIVKTMGTDNIEISIYDDYEAYQLSEVKCGQEFKTINNSEKDSIDRHTVAVYSGNNVNHISNHTLWYYPEVRNNYTEKEVYYP